MKGKSMRSSLFRKTILLLLLVVLLFSSCGKSVPSSSKYSKEEKLTKVEKEEQKISGVVAFYVDPFENSDLEKSLKQRALQNGKKENDYYDKFKTEMNGILSELESLGFQIVKREHTDQIIKELRFQNSEWATSKNLLTIGDALNADYAILFGLSSISDTRGSLFGELNMHLTVELFNLRTMQVSTFISTDFGYNISSKDREMIINAVDPQSINQGFYILGTWYYDGLKKSVIKYSGSEIKYITPFAGNMLLENASNQEQKKFNSLNIIRSIEFLGNGTVTITDTNGKQSSGKYAFTPCDLEKEYSGGSYYSTLKVGRLTVRSDRWGLLFSDCDVFAKENTFGVYVGLEKGSSGRAFFQMFSSI